jgi:hypothetical protein
MQLHFQGKRICRSRIPTAQRSTQWCAPNLHPVPPTHCADSLLRLAIFWTRVQRGDTAIREYLFENRRVLQRRDAHLSHRRASPVYATPSRFTPAKPLFRSDTRGGQVHSAVEHGTCAGFSEPLPNWALNIPRIGSATRDCRSVPYQCIPNQVGEGGTTGIDTYCPESSCINAKLHVLHHTALQTADTSTRDAINREIDSYIVPCAILRGWVGGTQPVKSLQCLHLTCTCAQTDPSHTIVMHVPQARIKCTTPVRIPIKSLFLLPLDELRYENLPDVGIFIRATMTKKFFSLTVRSQHERMYNLFTYGNKRGTKKRSNNSNPPLSTCVKHWSEIICNSWFTSLLLETIPCLNRYKRGFKHTYDSNTVDSKEVYACIQIMYGSLLKLYPRGSKVPTFCARVNIVRRVQTLLELTQDEQMQFVTTYPALVKICLMEYCYNVLLDFFPVEYALMCTHPSMKMYETTARIMFDTFRRDIVSTGLEPWKAMDTKATSSIERCMRMCKFKMNKNALVRNTPVVCIPGFQNPIWNMRTARGDIAVLSRIYTDMPKQDIVLANILQSNIMTYPLPLCVGEKQKQSMYALFGACDSNVEAVQYMYICSTCILNGKGFKNKMRMCGLTGTLQCDDCCSDNILKINMIGVIVRLCNSSLYMCPQCCRTCMWKGNGTDLAKCGCVPQDTHTTRKTCCSVCSSRYVVAGPLFYPDMENSRINRVFLCGKHLLPKHTLSFIENYADLQAAIRRSRCKKVCTRGK